MVTAHRQFFPTSRIPLVAGLLSGAAASGLVSWATPDGNLVVTLVPGMVAGLVVYGLATWRTRRAG